MTGAECFTFTNMTIITLPYQIYFIESYLTTHPKTFSLKAVLADSLHNKF